MEQEINKVPILDNVSFIGIDPSVQNCGLAIIQKGMLQSFVVSPPDGLVSVRRLDWFRTELRKLLRSLTYHRVRAVAIEGYAYKATSHAHKIGEFGGVVRLACYDLMIQTFIVPPNSLKKFATGKGNAGKPIIIRELYRRWGVVIDDDNEADATVLALLAMAMTTDMDLTQVQQSAMTGLERLPSIRRRIRS